MNKYWLLEINNGVANEIEVIAYDIVQAIQFSGFRYQNIIKIKLIGKAQ